jgi:hypothetical protein
MIPDDESMIRKEQKPTSPPTPTPGLVEKLEAQGFRPFTDEW